MPSRVWTFTTDARQTGFVAGTYAHRDLHGGDGHAEDGLPAFQAVATELGVESDLRTGSGSRLILFIDCTISGVAVASWPLAGLERPADCSIVFDTLLEARLDALLILKLKTRGNDDTLGLSLAAAGSAWAPSSIHPVVEELPVVFTLPGTLLFAFAPADLPAPAAGMRTQVRSNNLVGAELIYARALRFAVVITGWPMLGGN